MHWQRKSTDYIRFLKKMGQNTLNGQLYIIIVEDCSNLNIRVQLWEWQKLMFPSIEVDDYWLLIWTKWSWYQPLSRATDIGSLLPRVTLLPCATLLPRPVSILAPQSHSSTPGLNFLICKIDIIPVPSLQDFTKYKWVKLPKESWHELLVLHFLFVFAFVFNAGS